MLTIQIFKVIIISLLLQIFLIEIVKKNLLKVLTFALIITPSPTLYGGSQTNTPPNLKRETEYNRRTSSSPITEAPEKPTNKTVISKDRDPSPNLEIAESSYPSSNLHNSVKKGAPLKRNCKKVKLAYVMLRKGRKM